MGACPARALAAVSVASLVVGSCTVEHWAVGKNAARHDHTGVGKDDAYDAYDA